MFVVTGFGRSSGLGATGTVTLAEFRLPARSAKLTETVSVPGEGNVSVTLLPRPAPLKSRVHANESGSMPDPLSLALTVNVALSPATANAGPLIVPVGSVSSIGGCVHVDLVEACAAFPARSRKPTLTV